MSKELMPVAWYPTRRWDWCDSKDEKKEIEPILSSNKIFLAALNISDSVMKLV